MLIDKNLTWKYHIDYIASKISRVVGIISRLRHSVPLNTLIQVYRSLIFPYTHYGIAAWGEAAQVYLRKVSFILQKRALRLMFFAGNRSHAIPLFVSANVLPLNMLYFETVGSLINDISTNSPPQNICDLFTCSSDLHTYNARFSDAGNLYINKSSVRIQLKRECPLKPSHIENIWHMMKNQNFSYSSQRYLRVSLETWCDFFLEIFF